MEKRQVNLTLEQARKIYKYGGEFSSLALEAFSLKELESNDNMPKTWEEFQTTFSDEEKISYSKETENMPSKYVALRKLELLRDVYRQGWLPSVSQPGVSIQWSAKGKFIVTKANSIDLTVNFLSFPDTEIAIKFMNNFIDILNEIRYFYW